MKEVGNFFRVVWWLLCHVWALVVIMMVIWAISGPTIPLVVLDGNLALMQFATGAIAKLGSLKWEWAVYFSAPYDMLNSVVGLIKSLTASREINLPIFGKKVIGLGQNVELFGRVVAEGIPLYFELKLIRFVDWCIKAPEKFRAWQAKPTDVVVTSHISGRRHVLR